MDALSQGLLVLADVITQPAAHAGSPMSHRVDSHQRWVKAVNMAVSLNLALKQLVFTTLFALVTLGGAYAAEVTVNIEGLRSNKGNVSLCLWVDRKGFPDCAKSASALKRTLPAAQANLPLVFQDLPAGTFAITLIHDENANGKFDFSLIGIPKEGAGASNNAISRFGPPGFTASSFTVRDKAVQNIRLIYWLGN